MIKQEDLIERCRRGDPAAYTALYNQHGHEVYNTILRLVSHTAEAEDLLQESFVAAFEGIKSFRNTGGFRAWVKRIAINKSIDRIRKRKLRFVELEPERTLTVEEDDENIDEEAFAYTMEAVNSAIEALPDGYRTVFNLYVVEGIPQAEIAEMLGLENTTVRTQYHRAKQKILMILREGGYDEKQTGRIYP
ncbi:MAG TPA: RNA polymerase sigma factor [Mucilaginibacter sp.]|jgi:RNA polymerase sigma-70 factor (ECF subfamily)